MLFSFFNCSILIRGTETSLSSCLEASTEVLISPEGLNQRFNKAVVQLLQHLLGVRKRFRV
ncbi:hypothetical protein COE15_27500 [Bacillus cereus]|nr:hypothetical protein CN288_25700 [Bacillus sp. AFS023182]PGX89762.1 hypothetical protein COE15_27500 [Bacillus cereus]